MRINIQITPSEREALTDWRFERRISSEAEAIRQLIAAGMKALGPRSESEAKEKSKADFGSMEPQR